MDRVKFSTIMASLQITASQNHSAVVVEWSKTLTSQVQVENTVAQVPGSNHDWGII